MSSRAYPIYASLTDSALLRILLDFSRPLSKDTKHVIDHSPPLAEKNEGVI